MWKICLFPPVVFSLRLNDLVTTSLGLYKKRELRKSFYLPSHGVDASNGSPAAVKIKRGINKKAA